MVGGAAMADTPVEEFQILSLDGGGFKGLFSAAVLAHFEEDLKVNITDHFDLIAGTSTGGIIAIGLGLGMRPRELVDFYVQNGGTIFPKKPLSRVTQWSRMWFRSKYRQLPLKTALRNILKDQPLGSSAKRLVIPSYNLSRDEVRIFKTPHHPRLTRDSRIPAWRVALATSAAPTYLPACDEIDHMRLIDGGIWANNPSMIALVEAHNLLSVPLDAIRIFSLGTCGETTLRPKRLDNGGKWQWRNAGIDIALRGQSLGTNNLILHLLGEQSIHRLDPVVPPNLYALDKITTDDLIAEAAHASLHFSPTFRDAYCTHFALPYQPCHPNTDATNPQEENTT